MKEKFMRFMQGRYGNDQFNRFLMIVAMVLLILSVFGLDLLYFIAIAVMVYVYFRMFSKQIYKRSAENQKYLQYEWKVKAKLQKKKSQLQQSKTHRIYKCPNCKQKIRVPKGRGRIATTCRKCGHEFIKKS
ncbi:MAG: hypothetical protein IJZ55_05955 [Lachnospiraceae bacterium]|nr:hypothetical protein [Lachnospiraceae bacterium]